METKKYIGEIWKPIRGYVGLYEVSNFGRVRSVNRIIVRSDGKIKRFRGMLLKFSKINSGYLTVTLSKDGKEKQYLIHRLVAETFIPNPKHLSQVNHKDENKLNNRLSNLEWCTERYNTNYGTAMERSANKRGHAVVLLTKERVCVAEFKSTREAARKTGHDHTYIADCCKGICIPSNCIWEYKY